MGPNDLPDRAPATRAAFNNLTHDAPLASWPATAFVLVGWALAVALVVAAFR